MGVVAPSEQDYRSLFPVAVTSQTDGIVVIEQPVVEIHEQSSLNEAPSFDDALTEGTVDEHEMIDSDDESDKRKKKKKEKNEKTTNHL